MNPSQIFKEILSYSNKRFSKNNPINNAGYQVLNVGKNMILDAGNKTYLIDPTEIRVNAVKNQLTNKNSGVFLYIIYYNTKSNQYKTEFIRPNPMFEFGTKHFQMRKKHLENDIIFAAGELRLDNTGHVVYNMLSGTYMLKIMMFYGMNPKPDKYNAANVERFYKTIIPQILKKQNPFVKNAKYNAANLVTPTMSRNKVTLQQLRNAGVQVVAFNSSQM
jgi:hypothetical protein